MTFANGAEASTLFGIRSSDLIDQEGRIMTKVGICISPFMGLSLAGLAEFAQESEKAGIEGIIPEGQNDGLICCYAAAKATNRVMVATWIVNIFLREAALCS